jgi:predicted amidohydrolase
MPSSGVTAVVDAGTAGCDNYRHFHETVVNRSEVRVKAQISCYPTGMAKGHENFDPVLFDEKGTAACFRDYPYEIIGLKIRLSHGLAKNIDTLAAAVRLSENIGGLPVCVHVTNSPCTMEEIACLLRKGDVMCHVYNGTGNTILDETGQVLKKIWQAKERGVVFDAAAGTMNGSHRVAKASLEQGFFPDVIGTDMTGDKLYYSSRARNLPFVMSRFISMGMSVFDVVRCVTEVPAKLMGEENRIGTLKPGAVGNVAVIALKERAFRCYDTDGVELIGDKFLVPQLTVLGGNIAFCQAEFNLPEHDFGV